MATLREKKRLGFRSLGWLLGVTTLGAGLAVADPVPMRPYKPKVPAQPPKCKTQERGIEPNGPDFNGTRIAQHPPCVPLPQVVEVRLKDGVSTDGKTSVKDVQLKDGAFMSATLKPPELRGAMMIGGSSTGGTVRLRIDAITPAPDPNPQTPINENAGLFVYQVSVQQGIVTPSNGQFQPNVGPAGEWSPLCESGQLAVAVPGTWDAQGKKVSEDGKFTFACQNSAIAKCVTLMGYRPWQKSAASGPVPFDELHQACVRAVRADYCGNGESMTQPGVQVNFYDRFNVSHDEKDWPLEALWSEAGALCVNSTRLEKAPEDLRTGRKAMPVLDYVKRTCPDRLSQKPCDAQAVKGTLMSTEAAPAAGRSSAPAKKS